jgi:hypothetical protein
MNATTETYAKKLSIRKQSTMLPERRKESVMIAGKEI